MIDIKKVATEFDDYASNYDSLDPKVKLKINHTHRVAKLSASIARSLGMDEENIKLATLIGYLHDLGRFEQIKRYNSFNDLLTVDHADYSDTVLFEEHLIRKFIDDDQYDDIIEAAVKNHNKKAIDPCVTGNALVHAKIIRDADKADIMWIYCHEKLEQVFAVNELPVDDHISAKVYNDFIKRGFIDKEDVRTGADLVILTAGFIYDANTEYFLKYVKQHRFMDIITSYVRYSNIDTAKKMAHINSHIYLSLLRV